MGGEDCLVKFSFVRLQNKQKGQLEKEVAFGTGLMMLNRSSYWGRDVEYQIVRLASSLLLLCALSLYWDEE